MKAVEFYETNFLNDTHPVIFRVFAQKFKDEAEHLELEAQATAEQFEGLLTRPSTY